MRFFKTICVASLLMFSISAAGSVLLADEPAKAGETVAVKLKDLTLTMPKSWAASDVKNSMRLATYDIPAAAGDKEKGELAVSTFAGGGGGIEPNLARWIGQFSAEGRKTVVKKGKAGENEYYIADITGTFQKPVGPPILRKTEAAAGYRMLGMIVVLKDEEVYFLKLTGPDATVKAQAEALRAAVGGKSAGETDYEL